MEPVPAARTATQLRGQAALQFLNGRRDGSNAAQAPSRLWPVHGVCRTHGFPQVDRCRRWRRQRGCPLHGRRNRGIAAHGDRALDFFANLRRQLAERPRLAQRHLLVLDYLPLEADHRPVAAVRKDHRSVPQGQQRILGPVPVQAGHRYQARHAQRPARRWVELLAQAKPAAFGQVAVLRDRHLAAASERGWLRPPDIKLCNGNAQLKVIP